MNIFSTNYILSQIGVLVYYVLIIITYQEKNRKKILMINTIALVIMALSYYLLSAYSGLAMMGLGIIRNIMFYFESDEAKITRNSIIKLSFLLILSLILSLFTYEGIFSMMSVIATVTYTISIWQKDMVVYKKLGLIVGIAGITYNIYIKSILGIILESLSFISAVVGILRDKEDKEILM